MTVIDGGNDYMSNLFVFSSSELNNKSHNLNAELWLCFSKRFWEPLNDWNYFRFKNSSPYRVSSCGTRSLTMPL